MPRSPHVEYRSLTRVVVFDEGSRWACCRGRPAAWLHVDNAVIVHAATPASPPAGCHSRYRAAYGTDRAPAAPACGRMVGLQTLLATCHLPAVSLTTPSPQAHRFADLLHRFAAVAPPTAPQAWSQPPHPISWLHSATAGQLSWSTQAGVAAIALGSPSPGVQLTASASSAKKKDVMG